eukprot:gene9093-1397_t
MQNNTTQDKTRQGKEEGEGGTGSRAGVERKQDERSKTARHQDSKTARQQDRPLKFPGSKTRAGAEAGGEAATAGRHRNNHSLTHSVSHLAA